MTDPVTLTTGAIVAIAASKFIEGAGAKVGELVTGGTLKQAGTQVSKLWGLIKGKFAGNQRAEEALGKVEAGDASALTKLEVYLDDELAEPQNQAFATEVRQLAQQIINVQQQVQVQQTNVNQGRDQFIVNNPTGDLKLGGS